jgi:hypothetical protein
MFLFRNDLASMFYKDDKEKIKNVINQIDLFIRGKIPLNEFLLFNPTLLFETLEKTPHWNMLGDFFLRFYCTPISEAIAERWIKSIKHKVGKHKTHTNAQMIINSLHMSVKQKK